MVSVFDDPLRKGGCTSDGKGTVNLGVPATVNASIADGDEDTDAEEELRYTGEVKGARVTEKRHDGGGQSVSILRDCWGS